MVAQSCQDMAKSRVVGQLPTTQEQAIESQADFDGIQRVGQVVERQGQSGLAASLSSNAEQERNTMSLRRVGPNITSERVDESMITAAC